VLDTLANDRCDRKQQAALWLAERRRALIKWTAHLAQAGAKRQAVLMTDKLRDLGVREDGKFLFGRGE